MVSLVADQPQPTDWPAAWAALAGMDGDEWCEELDRLYALWKVEYVGAFVAYAPSRKSHKWTREIAETWAAHQIADDAFHDPHGTDPSDAAQHDVVECEWEIANAE